MTREDKIAELKAIGLRAIPTVITFDMGLEYDYITPDGAGTSFGGMGGWPAHIIRSVDQNKWHAIRDSIRNSTLEFKDLEGTDLFYLSKNIHSLHDFDLSEALDGILKLPDSMENNFYCFYDTGIWYNSFEKPQFFLSEMDIKEAFIQDFVNDLETWDEMDDDTLDTWYDRINDDMNQFYFVTYDDEEDAAD